MEQAFICLSNFLLDTPFTIGMVIQNRDYPRINYYCFIHHTKRTQELLFYCSCCIHALFFSVFCNFRFSLYFLSPYLNTNVSLHILTSPSLLFQPIFFFFFPLPILLSPSTYLPTLHTFLFLPFSFLPSSRCYDFSFHFLIPIFHSKFFIFLPLLFTLPPHVSIFIFLFRFSLFSSIFSFYF